MSQKAIATIGTILKFGLSAGSLTELCKIKSYPQLGGEREQIETTDLCDSQQTFVPGVQSVEPMVFGANYLITTYTSLKANAMKDGFFELDFGPTGGKATWEGQYDVYVNEGGVNEAVQMSIVVYPSTEITIAAGGSST